MDIMGSEENVEVRIVGFEGQLHEQQRQMHHESRH
jgi:hypothetical protein